MTKFVVYTDGGARGNPGPAGAGVVITDASGRTLKKVSKALGKQTNNYAEYGAVILAIETLKKMIPKASRATSEIIFKMDSELVARQLSGKYQIKEESLFPLFIKIWNARVSDFPRMTFTEIPREENTEADALSNEAMEAVEQKKLL